MQDLRVSIKAMSLTIASHQSVSRGDHLHLDVNHCFALQWGLCC